jgi:hypothetical protein
MNVNNLVQGDDGLWKFLDANDTPFWFAVFHSKIDALKAYEIWKGNSLPAEPRHNSHVDALKNF